ncbi:unnamed protein product [Gadus morhua 'NCC']
MLTALPSPPPPGSVEMSGDRAESPPLTTRYGVSAPAAERRALGLVLGLPREEEKKKEKGLRRVQTASRPGEMA